jgi:hypothetical protein
MEIRIFGIKELFETKTGSQRANRETNNYFVRFEAFTAVTMKNGVFWVVTPCGSY